MKAIDESQGLVKLEEALQHLTIKFRYDVNERPILLPEDASADDIFSFLGVSEAWVKESGSSRATLAAKLLSQWNSYCSWRRSCRWRSSLALLSLALLAAPPLLRQARSRWRLRGSTW